MPCKGQDPVAQPMAAPLPTPLLPDCQAETTLINFTVTERGLEDQLLALVVNKERADLEEAKGALIVQNSGKRRVLRSCCAAVCRAGRCCAGCVCCAGPGWQSWL